MDATEIAGIAEGNFHTERFNNLNYMVICDWTPR